MQSTAEPEPVTQFGAGLAALRGRWLT
jgi:hypothetical protein